MKITELFESSTNTYYVHVDDDGKPCGPKAKHEGTDKYGYKSLKIAIQHCPKSASVEERHQTHSDDWAGRIMGHKDEDGSWHPVVK